MFANLVGVTSSIFTSNKSALFSKKCRSSNDATTFAPRHYATTFFHFPAKNKCSPLFSPPFSNIFRPPLSFRRNLFRSLIMTTNNFHYFMLSPLKLFSVKETIIGSKIHAIWHVLDTHHTNFTTSLWNSRPSTVHCRSLLIVGLLVTFIWPLLHLLSENCHHQGYQPQCTPNYPGNYHISSPTYNKSLFMELTPETLFIRN